MTNSPKETRQCVLKKAMITYDVPIFEKYISPNGFLNRDMACQALFRYYLSASDAHDRWNKQVTLEGDPDIPKPNYKGLFTTWAQCYGVTPERMVKFWPNVDMQCTMNKFAKLPDVEEIRFNKVPELRTQ